VKVGRVGVLNPAIGICLIRIDIPVVFGYSGVMFIVEKQAGKESGKPFHQSNAVS